MTACRTGLRFTRVLFSVSVLIAPLLTGCVTTAQRPWGADVTLRPGMQRLRDAAIDSAKSPGVWLPLAGAATLQINDWDRKVSNWARENTPVFGSQRSAADWSNRLRTASSVAYVATVLATPGADTARNWFEDKTKGLAVGLGAIAVTAGMTTLLKKTSGRTRPNGQGNKSFPSGHASHSAVLTGLARDNLRETSIDDRTRHVLDFGLDALTAGTAWARVEAGAHFPADTLVGIALGNYISSVFDNTFFSSTSDRRVAWTVTPLPGGLELNWEASF